MHSFRCLRTANKKKKKDVEAKKKKEKEKKKMVDVQPPPLRSLDDFLLSSARFAVPDVRDVDRWNHRVINNLLYYQSNYLLSVLAFLLLVG